MPPAVEVKSPNQWAARKFTSIHVYQKTLRYQVKIVEGTISQNYFKEHVSRKLESNWEREREKGREGERQERREQKKKKPKHHTQSDYKEPRNHWGGLEERGVLGPSWKLSTRSMAHCAVPSEYEILIGCNSLFLAFPTPSTPWGQAVCFVFHCTSSPSTKPIFTKCKNELVSKQIFACGFSPWLYSQLL